MARTKESAAAKPARAPQTPMPPIDKAQKKKAREAPRFAKLRERKILAKRVRNRAIRLESARKHDVPDFSALGADAFTPRCDDASAGDFDAYDDLDEDLINGALSIFETKADAAWRSAVSESAEEIYRAAKRCYTSEVHSADLQERFNGAIAKLDAEQEQQEQEQEQEP